MNPPVALIDPPGRFEADSPHQKDLYTRVRGVTVLRTSPWNCLKSPRDTDVWSSERSKCSCLELSGLRIPVKLTVETVVKILFRQFRKGRSANFGRRGFSEVRPARSYAERYV